MLTEFCPGGVGIADSDRVDGSNLVDDMLLYQITGREIVNCMEKWRRRSQPAPYRESAQTSFFFDDER